MTKFNILYRPSKHEGVPNREGKTFNYEVFTPEAGFGNSKEGNQFAGFKARKTDTGEYRNFRWNRVVALVPAG